jgi:hypothetical protein
MTTTCYVLGLTLHKKIHGIILLYMFQREAKKKMGGFETV